VTPVPSTPDNGFDGLYGGYQIISLKNLGALQLKGLEIDFKQRLYFLPGALKGLTIRGNYTWLRADAQFYFTATQVGAIARNTRQIPGVIPRAGNLGFQYNYRKFGATLDVNYTGEYPVTNVATVTTPAFTQLIAYRKELTRVNAGITYRVRPDATLFFNASNIGQTGPDIYTFVTNRPRQHTISLMSLSLGVSGQF